MSRGGGMARKLASRKQHARFTITARSYTAGGGVTTVWWVCTCGTGGRVEAADVNAAEAAAYSAWLAHHRQETRAS